jgi:hypothetical protein
MNPNRLSADRAVPAGAARTKPLHQADTHAGPQETTVKPHDYRFLSWREHLALGVAAAGAAVLVAAGAVAPFAVDGSTPYFGNDAASLAAVEGCRELPPRAQRHACLRKVAAAREAAARNALALAEPAR